MFDLSETSNQVWSKSYSDCESNYTFYRIWLNFEPFLAWWGDLHNKNSVYLLGFIFLRFYTNFDQSRAKTAWKVSLFLIFGPILGIFWPVLASTGRSDYSYSQKLNAHIKIYHSEPPCKVSTKSDEKHPRNCNFFHFWAKFGPFLGHLTWTRWIYPILLICVC